MLKHLLVGYDGSDTSRQAFRFAMELARLCQGRVRVVSVLQVAEGGDTCALMMTETSGQLVHDLMDELKTLEPDAAALADPAVIHGTPGDVLLGQVQPYGIDHIVIGHTERGALARWLLGSVSSDVLAHSRVPVTVVP